MQQVAIITGASQGIGAAIAVHLAEKQVHTILIARNLAKLEEVAGNIRSKGGLCSYYPCDVTQPGEVEHTVKNIRQEIAGSPQILINNAGYGGPFHQTDEVAEKEWDLVFDTNVKAAFLFCSRLLPGMKENNYGRIINIASVYGVVGGAYSSTYAASKHALIGYTRSIAIEWASWNITCNVISPGYVDTSMGLSPGNDSSARILDQIPCKRQATPAEIARMVVFLVDPENSYINGSNIIIDGGLLAGLAS